MAFYHSLIGAAVFAGGIGLLFLLMLGVHSCLTRTCTCCEDKDRETYVTINDDLSPPAP